jgi:hypothetical protein
MTESAREEAFRLGEESGLLAAIREEWDYMEEATIPAGSMAAIERLIALARQRPGWVWVPEEPPLGLCTVFDQASHDGRRAWVDRIHEGLRAVFKEAAKLAAAPKLEEGE